MYEGQEEVDIRVVLSTFELGFDSTASQAPTS